MSYELFREFHDKHPDLDNAEYYAEFPDTNKSTVRSWKSRANKPIEVPPTPAVSIPDPTPEEAEQGKGYEELVIESLCTLTKTPKNSLRGMSVKDQIQFLKNRRDDLAKEPKSDRASNSSILPTPRPIGSSTREFGLDEYITFDGVKNEIRMEIPMPVLFDPEQNKNLGERK